MEGRTEGVRATKGADALRVEDRMRRGRPRLRWEDCVKRYLVLVEGKWRKRESDRGSGDGGREASETGIVMKKKGKNRRPVSVPASPRTTGKKRRATTTCHRYEA